jgi:Alpha/beta hydrolase domain
VVITPVPGKPNLLLGAYDPAVLGYRAEEFFVSGTASSYVPTADCGPDGRWSVVPSDEAEYTTRIVVLRPTDDAAFNGTVIVEWLNVSGGIDAPAVWTMAHREMVREGYAYVGVSAQRVGIDGGLSLDLGVDMSLKTQDPERYSGLTHPGDAFAYDIFSQVGRLVGRQNGAGVLDGLRPEYVLAVGESQSAVFLTTYINAVDPLAEAYHGFLVHSRFGPAAPLDGGSLVELTDADASAPVWFRPDLRVPVVAFIAESDLLGAVLPGYLEARQPDNDRLRVWEVAGIAHADNYTIQVGYIDTGSTPLADIVAAYAPTNVLMGQQLSYRINFAPQHHYVLQAALARLHDWVRGGTPAPTAGPIILTDDEPPGFALDANGLATGGIRTPWVDVPIARTSGIGSDETVLALLFGTGEPFDAATLAGLYPGGSAEYLERFTAALDSAIDAGFIVAADRPEILELAEATFPR